MTRILNIAGRLHTIADDGVLISSDELLDERKNKKQNVVNADVDSALADRYTKSEVYTKQEVNNLVSPNQNYVTVAEFTDLPISGATDTIYRVSSWDGSLSTPAVDVTKYSEYAWDGTGYVLLCVKTQIGEVYDISAANSGAKYADLSAALGVDGGNVPSEIRRGGMSVKFVQSSDNKYVQYRLMSDSFNTTPSNWQGLDDEPTENSENLVKSGGVHSAIQTSMDVALAALDTIANADDFPTEDSQELVRSGGVYAAIVAIANMILSVSNRFPQTQNGGFHIVDSDNNIGMRYDENGLDFAAIASHAISLLIDSGIAGYDYVSEEIARLEAMIGGGGGGHDSHIELTAENGMYFVDENLNIGAYLDENGFHAKNIIEYEIINQ